MKKIQKPIAYVLCMMLVIGLLTACDGKENEGGKKPGENVENVNTESDYQNTIVASRPAASANNSKASVYP